MEWNRTFDFLSADDIRIKGTRVGIETVSDDYLNSASPEEIAVRYRTLTLEQVYAPITYSLHNQKEVVPRLGVPGALTTVYAALL